MDGNIGDVALPPAYLLLNIAKALLNETEEFYDRILADLEEKGYPRVYAKNILRFSFCLLISGYFCRLETLQWEDKFEPFTPESNWNSTIEMINATVEMLKEPVKEGTKLFATTEDKEFCIIMAVHANGEEFNTANYAAAINKSQKAYFRQKGYVFHDRPRAYLNKLFATDDIRNYFDSIPKKLRMELFRAVEKYRQDKNPWSSYLYNVVMEWNGMTLIREAHRIIMFDTPRKFLSNAKYVDQIEKFKKWWNQHNSDVEKRENFRFLWYLHPEELEDVIHAKFTQLFTIILRILKDSGRTVSYSGPRLNYLSVPAIDTEPADNINVLTPEYLALINKRMLQYPRPQ